MRSSVTAATEDPAVEDAAEVFADPFLPFGSLINRGDGDEAPLRAWISLNRHKAAHSPAP